MPLTAPAPTPTRITDVVHEQLRQAILAGELAPGEQLTVPKLATTLNVSRGSVREAVLQLVADGLAEERPRHGVQVVSLGATEMRQLHEVREVLEGLAARLAASSADPELVETLDDLLAAQERSVDSDDGATYASTDERFHLVLAEACGNAVLRSLVERFHAQMTVALAGVAEAPTHRRLGHGELREVLHAVRTRRPDDAEAAMRAHIRRTRAALDEADRSPTTP